ncbi:MAG TPA: peptidylprolyl isomerase [Rhizomicrobium sp.]|jgi:peptidylprolyl isomerase|nr:peptidylprolyl isomerase [Rhizomicrobium sp.]
MDMLGRFAMKLAMLCFGILLATALPVDAASPAPADILKNSPDVDWRPLDPSSLLVMSLPAGPVVIDLAPAFAPASVANITALVRAHYFDGSTVVRAQDNFVVQWAQDEEREKAAPALKGQAEFERPLSATFIALADSDTYAARTGFDGDFPAATDGRQEWLTHCYGMVAVARDTAPDSGTGVELYAVIGQAPRQLDRNFTPVGRVVQGVERLSVLPRGTGSLGFYQTAAERVPIASIRFASDLSSAEQPKLEVLKTSSATFKAYVEARRNQIGMYVRPAGHMDVCNIPLPVRASR